MARELVESRLPWPTYSSLSFVSPSLSVGAIGSSHPSLPLRVPFHQNVVFTGAFWGFLPLVNPFPEQMSRCGIDGAEQEFPAQGSSWAPPPSTLGSAASSLTLTSTLPYGTHSHGAEADAETCVLDASVQTAVRAKAPRGCL